MIISITDKLLTLLFIAHLVSGVDYPPNNYAFLFPSAPHTATAMLNDIHIPPESGELSVSLWIYQVRNDDGENIYISYSTGAATGFNAFIFGVKDTSFSWVFNNNIVTFTNNAKLNEWVHYTITWKSSDGQVNFYIDGQLHHSQYYSQVKGLKLENKKGILVLAQDQDTHGGGFDVHQSFRGKMTEVNVWDRALSEYEVQGAFNSELEGNVIAWSKIIWKLYNGVAPVIVTKKPI